MAQVAVGTEVTPDPRTDPYVQNYRIRLLPWMLTGKPHIWIRMKDLRRR